MEKDDFIRRKVAILMVQRYGVGCLDPDEFTPEQAERFVIARLQAMPAADVRPVVKAHWKPGDIRNVSAVCSNCGHLRLGNGAEWATKLAHFCEKCGADMMPEPPKEET